jgi:hypothetical protein
MAPLIGEKLETTSRYWYQSAHMAVRDVYDALIEIITNSDDRYVRLKPECGRIEIEIERKRNGPSLVVVRDFADGMTLDVMKKKLRIVGGRVSGMAEGERVRGTNSRGAKDVAILGGVIFESIAAEDGKYHGCEITPQGIFRPDNSCPKDAKPFRPKLKIPEGSGTVVTICVNSDVTQIPQHDTLKEKLGQLIALRDILNSSNREIVLHDINKDRTDKITAPRFDGTERISERLKIPGYEGAEAKLSISRSKTRFDDRTPRFRRGGILVKSKHAIHQATLFASDLENDPNAQWFYGRLTCDFIDELWNEFDDRLEKGLKSIPKNPRPIYDPSRKEGLSREHPFIDALFKEALKRLRPLVEEERQRVEKQQAQIESNDTRKRLNALEKAAAKFISENRVSEEANRNADDTISDSIFEKKGYSLTPPFCQMVAGQSRQFWLNIKQKAFPEFSIGDPVEISCLTNDITASRQFGNLEAHPSRENVLRFVWKVKAEKATKATAVRVRCGSIVGECHIEIFAEEKDRFADVKSLCFNRQRYTVEIGSKRNFWLYAPCRDGLERPTGIEIECPNDKFKITGERIMQPFPKLGVSKCKLTLTVLAPNQQATINASVLGQTCSAEVVSLGPLGPAIEIKMNSDMEMKNQRYFWRGNILEIAARHPSINRYLGPAPKYPGQEDDRYKVLLAEIVAEAVCSQLLGRNIKDQPEEYADMDWDAYYAEYCRMMTKFLPIAHETQVKS